ncbi:MAG TPA: hypothetical protein VFK59_06730 [Actinomycetota bacterium]|nr:hypothetical protein [Actinomycetota bacterium]
MDRKMAVGALVGALLMSSLLVGVGYAGGAGSTHATVPDEPTVIELVWKTGAKDTNIRFIPLAGDKPGGPFKAEGPTTGQITTKKLTLFDVDGNEVGRQYIDCLVTIDTPWICTLVSVLKDGPNTDKGTVVATGYSKHTPGMPNISSIPITGGTGAYNNAGGHAIQEGVDGTVKYTLFLVRA